MDRGMEKQNILLIIVLMTAVTAPMRLLPVWLLSARPIPTKLQAWLRYVPIAVIAAMLLPSLFIREDVLALSSSNLYLWVALPTIWVAAKTKNLAITVISGMGLLALARYLW